jgi:hypothetical protein
MRSIEIRLQESGYHASLRGVLVDRPEKAMKEH